MLSVGNNRSRFDVSYLSSRLASTLAITSTYREDTEWNEHDRVEDGFGDGARFALIG